MGIGGNDSLRDLGARLIDQGKAYARAEVEVVKQTGLSYVRATYVSIILIGAALLVLLSALPVLIAALGMTIAIWTGPAAGLAIAGILAVILAGLLAGLALRRFGRIGERSR